MANKVLRFNYNELPHILKEFVSEVSVVGSDNNDAGDPTEVVSEQEYYKAFESLLQYRHYGEADRSSESSSTDRAVVPTPLTAEQHLELADFHLNRCMSAWITDHAAHKNYAYYPSWAYPMGSTMEYLFFMGPWKRNVNYPHVRRLYDRSGDFANILAQVDMDLCPCKYLIKFNVFEAVEYNLDDNHSSETEEHGGNVLYLLTIENELMMRSEFFNRKKQYYQTFNMWLYDRFLDPLGDMRESLLAVTKLQPAAVNANNAKASLYRHLKYKVRARKQKSKPISEINCQSSVDASASPLTPPVKQTPVVSDSPKDIRLRRMEQLNSRLLFGEPCSSEGSERQLLVRCEDYTSHLYSPRLKITSCHHPEEDVTFEQRRSGDEIKTEIRTCRKCGKVRVITN